MPTGYKKRTWTDTRARPSTTDYTDMRSAPNPRRCVERHVNSRLKHVTVERATHRVRWACLHFRNTLHVFLLTFVEAWSEVSL